MPSSIPANTVSPGSGAGSFRARFFLVLGIAGIFFGNFLSRLILSPLLPFIEADLHIRHTEAGSFFLMISAGYCVGLLVSGLLASRIGHTRTIAVSSAALGACLLVVAASDSLLALFPALLLLGAAAGIYLPSGITTLTTVLDPQDWGKGLSIHEMAPSLAFICAPLLVEILDGKHSWQGVLVPIGIALVLAGFLFPRIYRDRQSRGTAPSLANIRAILRLKQYWIMIALFGLNVGTNLGVYTMLPLYLQLERGMEVDTANTILGFSRISAIATPFIAGFLADRFGARRVLAPLLAGIGAATILLTLAPGSWMLPFLFLQPMLAACYFPLGFAILSTIVPAELRNVVISLTIPPAMLLGAGVIPTLIGSFGDVGSFAAGIALVGVLVLVSTPSTTFLRR